MTKTQLEKAAHALRDLAAAIPEFDHLDILACLEGEVLSEQECGEIEEIMEEI